MPQRPSGRSQPWPGTGNRAAARRWRIPPLGVAGGASAADTTCPAFAIKPAASSVEGRRLDYRSSPSSRARSAAPSKLAFRYAHRPSLQKGFAFPARSEINRPAAVVQFFKPLFDGAEPPIAELFVPVWDKARHGPVVS